MSGQVIQMPQSVESEAVVLGSMMIEPDVCAEALDLLTESDFSSERTRLVFATIKRLHSNKQPADSVTVGIELDKVMPGALSYCSKLIEVPTTTIWEYHAKRICGTAIRRQAITAIDQARTKLMDQQSDLAEVVDQLQSNIFSIGDAATSDAAMSAEDFMVDSLEHYRSIEQGTIEPGLKTGFKVIDHATGGLMSDTYIVLAARPKMGKTALMMDMADNIASNGHKVGIFSCEMSKRALRDRWISKSTGISTVDLRNPKQIRENWNRISEATDKIASLNLMVDATGGMAIGELKRRCRKMVRAGVEIIFIDQLSWIRGEGRDEFAKAAHVSSEIASLKKELHIPIVLLAQINREGGKLDRPTKSNLKNTGRLEEDADIVMLLHRPWVDHEHDDSYKDSNPLCTHDYAVVELIQREGPSADASLRFSSSTTTFRNPTLSEVLDEKKIREQSERSKKTKQGGGR